MKGGALSLPESASDSRLSLSRAAIVTTGTATHGATGTEAATAVPSPTDTAGIAGTSPASGSAALSSASASGAASSATPSSTTTESDKILGLSKAVFIAICVVAGLVVFGVLVCCCCLGRSGSSAAGAAAPGAANELGVSDSEEEEKRFRRESLLLFRDCFASSYTEHECSFLRTPLQPRRSAAAQLIRPEAFSYSGWSMKRGRRRRPSRSDFSQALLCCSSWTCCEAEHFASTR